MVVRACSNCAQEDRADLTSPVLRAGRSVMAQQYTQANLQLLQLSPHLAVAPQSISATHIIRRASRFPSGARLLIVYGMHVILKHV